tara:strand:- start:1385 stop:1945 length:561 start_codon:yes stop_codon:yes gene_type:complete
MTQLVDFVFNNISRIGNDDYNFTQENLMNKTHLGYNTSNFSELNDNKVINLASSHPTMNMKGGFQVSPNGGNVDESGELINSKLTNLNFKISLQERTFKTVPYLGRGNVDVGMENDLRKGDTLREKKSAVKINEECQVNVDKYPMQKKLQKRLSSKHIVEESAANGWVRGGLPSREIYKNEKYECN